MTLHLNHSSREDTALYRIQIKGMFDSTWSDWFDNLSLSVVVDQGNSVTTLFGFVPDQSALHGLLDRIRDLGLTLLLVERLDKGPNFLQ